MARPSWLLRAQGAESFPMKVLVVGATGALGRPVVQGLRARGVEVRALNRHPEQAANLAALGAEVVAGDLTDPASLARACDGLAYERRSRGGARTGAR